MSRIAARSLAVCLFLLVAHGPAAARAQDEGAARAALDRGDFERARHLAIAAIESGVHTAATLAPLYRVLAVSAARAGDEEAARRAFTVLLGLDPEVRLARTEPDEIRSPYLEARGFWSSAPERLGATLRIAEDGESVELRVSDPAAMVARVRLRIRAIGGELVETVRAPEATMSIPMLGLARGVEYAIGFLDEHGNRLWQSGRDGAWERIEGSRVASPAPRSPGAAERPDATAFHVGAVSSWVVALAAGAGGAVAHLERERLAEVWNREDPMRARCTGAGTTLAEVCADERARITDTETIAGVLYATAGAALIVGVVLLIAAPSSGQDAVTTGWSCAPGPGTVGVACSFDL